MKVFVTVLYDAANKEEADEISKVLPVIPNATWTQDNLERVDRGILLEAGKSAGLAQFRAVAAELNPLDQG